MVPAASHRIPRVPWYLRTPLEDQSTFAYRAVTAYGGPFQGPSASGWFGNFDAIRQDGLRLVQPPCRNGSLRVFFALVTLNHFLRYSVLKVHVAARGRASNDTHRAALSNTWR